MSAAVLVYYAIRKGELSHFGQRTLVNPFCLISFLAYFANIFGLFKGGCDFSLIVIESMSIPWTQKVELFLPT